MPNMAVPERSHWPSCYQLHRRAPTGRCSPGCTSWRRGSSGWCGWHGAPGPTAQHEECSAHHPPEGGETIEKGSMEIAFSISASQYSLQGKDDAQFKKWEAAQVYSRCLLLLLYTSGYIDADILADIWHLFIISINQ